MEKQIIKIEDNIITTRVSDVRTLVLMIIKGEYNLVTTRYDCLAPHRTYLCENKKRLSTINKYAEKYGVMFKKKIVREVRKAND